MKCRIKNLLISVFWVAVFMGTAAPTFPRDHSPVEGVLTEAESAKSESGHESRRDSDSDDESDVDSDDESDADSDDESDADSDLILGPDAPPVHAGKFTLSKLPPLGRLSEQIKEVGLRKERSLVTASSYKVGGKTYQLESLLGARSERDITLVRRVDTGDLYTICQREFQKGYHSGRSSSRLSDTEVIKRDLQFKAKREVFVLNKIRAERHPMKGLIEVEFAGLAYREKTVRATLIQKFYNRKDAKSYPGQLSTDQLHAIAEDLLTGLSTLHRWGVIHRDIKPSNVLLSEDGSRIGAVLADFETSYSSKVDLPFFKNAEKESQGTLSFWSPQYGLKEFRKLPWTADSDQKNDLWAMGTTLFLLATGQQASSAPPWWDENLMGFGRLNQKQLDGFLNEAEEVTFRSLSSAIRCLLRIRPEERCSAATALMKLTSQR